MTIMTIRTVKITTMRFPLSSEMAVMTEKYGGMQKITRLSRQGSGTVTVIF